ncbi:hypothetical protein [Coralliovum pocilloporae]|uniref:hypothetical protein n=1 Tax=Coralliovum pocilloporae TaxID=3066369 RepID=UPI0033077178
MIHLVSDQKTIELSVEYDRTAKILLWKQLSDAHLSWRQTQTGRGGFPAFHDHFRRKVLDFQDSDTTLVNPETKQPFELGSLSYKTLDRFLNGSMNRVAKTELHTCRSVQAYLIAQNRGALVLFNRETFLDTLGASTAIQYYDEGSPPDRYSLGALKRERCLYVCHEQTSQIPGPLQSKLILIYITKIPNEHFYWVSIIPLPEEIEFSRLSITGKDLSDWNEEQYSGVGIATRNGVSCHLTSHNAHIPLYLLFKADPDEQLECSFVSFATPGYLQPFSSIEVLDRPDIQIFFDNFERIV